MAEQLEVKLNTAPSEELLTDALLKITGALNIFWCPRPVKGQPYNGHAHLDYPSGVVNPIRSPLTDIDLINFISS